MSNETPQTDWTELKGKIKTRWNKLVDADIDSFKGNMHLVPEKVQKVYGITKDKADQEYAEFNKGLEVKPATAAEKASPN